MCIYTLSDEDRCTKCNEQVTTNDMASEGFGFSLVTLDSSCTKPNFFKDTTLFLKFCTIKALLCSYVAIASIVVVNECICSC